MIKTLIIEDELPAAKRLERMLKDCHTEIQVVDILDSIEASTRWFNNNPHPNLVMLDIQLADGQSFEIFKQVKIESFVIFTTAYDEYALKAFELNSIDYLLKPVRPEQLQKSIEKFLKLKEGDPQGIQVLDKIVSYMSQKNTNYKKRFVINIGSHIKIIESEEIAYFRSQDKNTFLCNLDGKEYPVDFSLDNLEELIHPEQFFRVNRQYMISYKSIQKIHVFSKSRIKLELLPTPQDEILVSSTKSHDFRAWLDK
jgi:two-component system, LytTR family, response regulator LytT